MKTIWKYPLVSTTVKLSVPHSAEILCAKLQYQTPVIWMLVDPKEYVVARLITCYTTGSDIPDKPGKYIDTLLLSDGNYILHIYDKGETIIPQHK